MGDDEGAGCITVSLGLGIVLILVGAEVTPGPAFLGNIVIFIGCVVCLPGALLVLIHMLN